MKKTYNPLYTSACSLIFIAGMLFTYSSSGQTFQKNTTVKQKNGFVTKWTQTPFDHHIFIENRGQFNSDIPEGNNVLFMANLGDIEAYFTNTGIVYRWNEQ
jgi:hypothetical protein